MNSEDSSYTASNNRPIFLKNVTKELVSMFGKPTKNGIEDVLLGKAFIQSWECEKFKIVFEFNYSGFLPKYTLYLTDINLEKIQKIKKLSE